MTSALKFRPKDRRARLVFTSGPGNCMPEHAGKIFAVIGPFDEFTDKRDLQDALEFLVRGYNLEESD